MPKNAIPLETAQEWAARWRENPENIVKAFLIPREDITELLKADSVGDVRAYVGIDENGTHKLMLVGVDELERDLINAEAGKFIYDFTKPCPSVCDTKSPLYTLEP